MPAALSHVTRKPATITAVITTAPPAGVTHGWDETIGSNEAQGDEVYDRLYRDEPERKQRRRRGRRRRDEQADMEANTFVEALHDDSLDSLGEPGTNGTSRVSDTTMNSVDDVMAWAARMRGELEEWQPGQAYQPQAALPAPEARELAGVPSLKRPARQAKEKVFRRWAAVTVLLVLVATGTGVTEVGLHGWAFFTFRNAGAAAGNAQNLNEDQGPGQVHDPHHR